MSNFSFDDFAVLVRNLDMTLIADGQPLRIVPLKSAVSMADAMRCSVDFGGSEAYIPLNKDGEKVESNVTIQHDSEGYCRLVGHLVLNKTQKDDESPAEPFDAQAFALYHGTDEAPTVLAVASLKSGFVIGDECYCDFTITTTNNYQSVSFNPNAFATLEDLNNGLDGLHLAYDKASGDIKLLDKEGHVIDQANIPVKSDVIIADGEEDYKYVKTDIQQDIHAAKAWMPEGSAAWNNVGEQLYEMQNAALVVANNEGGIEEVLGIAVITESSEGTRMTMYRMDDENRLVPVSRGEGVAWLSESESEYDDKTMELKYSLDAFVWTVKDSMDDTESFFGKLNASLIALGFHVGDDIALGTNLQELANLENGIDAEEYMHGDDADKRAYEVKEQRELAKAELVAWNEQHPALTKDISAGTRISSDGVDIRNGSLKIGDGSGLEPKDNVKHYELATNFSDGKPASDTGLSLSVMDDSDGTYRNVLTVSESAYISGAPICMAMVEITAGGIDGDTSISAETKRRTANFECDMYEVDDTVSIELKDNRDNTKGFMDDCIVEITPVYISDGSAPEMLPALNQVNTVGIAAESEDSGKPTTLTCTCPQIIDWASSVNLGEGSEDGNGARLFAIVKVY